MTDPLQNALHAAAVSSSTLTSLAVFCATTLLYVLMFALMILGLAKTRAVTWTLIARVVISGLIAGVLTLVFKSFVNDPRPFVVEHYAPLDHATKDNGFPSDHTLAAMLLAGWAWWLDRRWITFFAVGAVAVLVGRLAIGAHHTLDIAGSVLFGWLGIVLAALIPLPSSLQRKILGSPGR